MLKLVLLMVVVVLVLSNKAPDEAPDLPEGWCVNGRETKTTGECICVSGACEGPKCVHAGIVFYKYTDCPTCKCVKKTRERDEAKVKTVGATPPADNREAKQVLKPHQYHERAPDAVEMSWEEYWEESWRHYFAVFISIIFFGLLGASIMSKLTRESVTVEEKST